MAAASPNNQEPIDLGSPPGTQFTQTRADLARWAAGDGGAFDELWRRYEPGLQILVAARLRGIEPAVRRHVDPDDVLQDVAMTVFGRLGEFEYRGQGSVFAWMSKVATNTLRDWLDYWRAGKRHPRVERPVVGPTTGTGTATRSSSVLADGAAGQATDLASREQRRRLAAAMAELPEREQYIVLARFFFGASWSEIAAEVGAASADAVRKECYLKVVPSLATPLARLGAAMDVVIAAAPPPRASRP